MAAHLLEFDSVHGRWPKAISAGEGSITVEGKKVTFSDHAKPGDVAWEQSCAEIVLECSGKLLTPEALKPYFDRNVTKVVVAAPVKQGALNIVMGVNDHLYDPAQHDIVTAASCTTNCLAPVVKVIHEKLGIRHGSITTIHDVTNTQSDGGRSAQGPAAGAIGTGFTHSNHDRLGDRNHFDLSGAQRPVERNCGPRSTLECVLDGLRVRGRARHHS